MLRSKIITINFATYCSKMKKCLFHSHAFALALGGNGMAQVPIHFSESYGAHVEIAPFEKITIETTTVKRSERNGRTETEINVLSAIAQYRLRTLALHRPMENCL